MIFIYDFIYLNIRESQSRKHSHTVHNNLLHKIIFKNVNYSINILWKKYVFQK
jgi:hypothetical protein